MAKHLKRASFWTYKSFLLFCNKTLAFIFAVFCVVTGQIKNISARQASDADSIVVAGQVFNAKDSSLIKNIKVVLYESLEGIDTWYGMINNPIEVVSKTNGTYDIESPSFKSSTSPVQCIIATDIDAEDNGSFKSCTLRVSLNSVDLDTTINIYMVPNETGIITKGSIKKDIIEIVKSEIVTIKLDCNSMFKNKIVRVYSSSGKMVEEINVSENGLIKWDTKSIARGSYVINIPYDNRILSTKIILK